MVIALAEPDKDLKEKAAKHAAMNAMRDAGVAALKAANAAKKLRAAKRKAGEDAGAECESSPAEGEARSPGNVTAKLRAMRKAMDTARTEASPA